MDESRQTCADERTDGQTGEQSTDRDRQTDGWTDGSTDRQTDRLVYRPTQAMDCESKLAPGGH